MAISLEVKKFVNTEYVGKFAEIELPIAQPEDEEPPRKARKKPDKKDKKEKKASFIRKRADYDGDDDDYDDIDSEIEAELDAAQPDLVVFLGDQIHGPSTGRSVERTQKALDAILQPVAARELPFAVVFGNHDDEGGVDKQTQLEYYRSYPGCLAEAGQRVIFP